MNGDDGEIIASGMIRETKKAEDNLGFLVVTTGSPRILV